MMRGSPAKPREAGFTLFELIVVVILVAVFAGVLLGRFLLYQEMAEKTAMEQTAGAVRSALNIQVAGLIARGRTEDIPKLATLNPMNLLTEQQKNYIGEFYETSMDDIPPGSWYFDLRHRELVYLVYRGGHFVPAEDGSKRVRYKVALVYNNGLLSSGQSGRKELGGVVLREVAPYKWEIQ